MRTHAKLVFIGSTGGGVLSRVAKHAFVRDMTLEAVSDRNCGFLTVAESFGIASVKYDSLDGQSFSDALYRRYRKRSDVFFISFYTRMFSGAFLQKNSGKILNCHPSILPSFKGMRGFEDTLESGCRFMGSTLHLVDTGMDTGTPVIQAAIPLDRSLPITENRHKVFLSQYYSTVQFLRWVYDGRVTFNTCEGISIARTNFSPSIFSPNLDPDFFEFIGEENGFDC